MEMQMDSNDTSESSDRSECKCCVELWLLWTFFAAFWVAVLIILISGFTVGPGIANAISTYGYEPLIVIGVIIITTVKGRHTCCNKTTKDEQPKQRKRRSGGSSRMAWFAVIYLWFLWGGWLEVVGMPFD